jgi:hypothetical protein
MEPSSSSRERNHSVPPLPGGFLTKLLGRTRAEDQNSRQRSMSMPSLTLGQHRREGTEDSDSSDVKVRTDHAFAVEIAGRYTTKHRPIGLAGLVNLDSTEETPDSESSSRPGKPAVSCDRGSDDETFSRSYTDRGGGGDFVLTHTEASESGESSARAWSRSRASSAVSDTDSPRSEDFVKPSEDRYSFVKGFGQPEGLQKRYSAPNLQKL